MPVYHFKNSPLIDRVEVDASHHGIARATIIAAENADGKKLEELRAQLGAKDFSTLMDSKDGRSVIQVRGFKGAEALKAALEQLGLANGGITTEKTSGDESKPSFREKVRGKALFLSALFYDLGNIALIVSGIQKGKHNPGGKMTGHDWSEMGIGASFSLGDVLMTFWGHDKGDEELQAADWGLRRHLHQKDIEIPQGDTLNPDTLHQSGLLKAADRWLRKHIVNIKCLTELGGGLFTIHSSLKKLNEKGETNRSKLAGGFLISTAWLATFLLDKPKGHHIFDDDKNGSTTFADKMVNNPRGWIARPAAMTNNFISIAGALGEKKKTQGQAGRHDYLYTILSASSFLVANSLFGISDNKRLNRTEDDKMMMNDMVLLSANVLAKQPEAVREVSIGEAADYVSRLAHVRLTRDQVEAAIRDKVEALSKGGWAARVQSFPSAPGPALN